MLCFQSPLIIFKSYKFQQHFPQFIINWIFLSPTKILLETNFNPKIWNLTKICPKSQALTLGFILYTMKSCDRSWPQRHLMTSSLTNHIPSYPLSALYIGKLPFISTNQKIQKWLIVIQVAQSPKGHTTSCIAQSCQSMSELAWSFYWAYVILLN